MTDRAFDNTLKPAKFSDKIIAPLAVPLAEQQRDKEKGVGLGWKWWHFRKRYMMTNPYCCHCGLLAQEIHHIKPRSTHPELMYDYANLLSLCNDCHTQHHRKHPVKKH